MSFKCSVFGHSFGDPVVDREREEAGSEVVITIRETQTCSRCGEERVVSENKEVTTLETPEEPDEPDESSAAGESATADASATGADEGGADRVGSGAGDQGDSAVVDAGADASADASAGETTGAGSSPDDGGSPDTADGPTVGEATAEMDDATIIEESPEQSIVEEAEPDDPVVSAEASGTTGGDAESEATDDDAVILEEDSVEDGDEGDREPGEWPEEPDDDGPEWSPPTDVSSAAAADVTDEQATEVEPTGEAVTVPDGSFRCPECGFTTPVESSSLRAGDFCPDCHTGTLVHDVDE